MDFNEANNILGNKKSKKLKNNTYLIRTDNDIVIKLHNTNIITFKSNGDIILTSGNWRTQVTKDRINEYADGFVLTIKNGIWILCKGNNKYIFEDGIVVSDKINGKLLTEDYTKEHNKLKNKISNYIDNYIDELLKGNIKQPTNGDCWYCIMKNEKGVPLGELTDSNHINSHIEENYFVPSLLLNAIKLYPVSILAKHSIFDCFNGEPYLYKDTKYQIKSSLKKYINKFIK